MSDLQREKFEAWFKRHHDIDYCPPNVKSVMFECWCAAIESVVDYENDGDGLQCQDCGKKDETVTRVNCPYAEEINSSIIVCDLCSDCYHERCMDI